MKKGLSRELMAIRVAREFKEGMYINLGMGLPGTVANYIQSGIEVVLHSENGILNYGNIPLEEEGWDTDLINASGNPIVTKPGICFFDSAIAFGMVRGGHIDVAVLGAYQVSERGDLANWAVGKEVIGVGGAMDLCFGVKRIWVVMEHTTKEGKPKVVRELSYPLTARGIVSAIFSDLAVIDVTSHGLRLREVAPGITPEEVQEKTEPGLIIPEDVPTMDL